MLQASLRLLKELIFNKRDCLRLMCLFLYLIMLIKAITKGGRIQKLICSKTAYGQLFRPVIALATANKVVMKALKIVVFNGLPILTKFQTIEIHDFIEVS